MCLFMCFTFGLLVHTHHFTAIGTTKTICETVTFHVFLFSLLLCDSINGDKCIESKNSEYLPPGFIKTGGDVNITLST